MKITYPECQIELDVDEAIELLDYIERTSPKLVWQPTDETLDDFLEGFKRVPDEESQPAPVPYPKEEEPSAVALSPSERGCRIPPFKGVGGLVGESVESTISRKNEIPKIPKTRKPYTISKKVQVLFETGWKTFNSISQAAKAIDTRLNHLSHALLNGKTCNGHHVRYATDNNEPTQPADEQQTELP